MDSETKMKQVIVEMVTGEKVEGTMANIDKEKKIITITNGKKMKDNGEEPELFSSLEIEKKDISKVKLLLYDTNKKEEGENKPKEKENEEQKEGGISSIPEDKQKPAKEILKAQQKDENCYNKNESFFDKLEGMSHPEAKQESQKYNDKNTETFNIPKGEEALNKKDNEGEGNERGRGHRGGRGRGGRGRGNRGRGGMWHGGDQRGGRGRGNRRGFNNMNTNAMMTNDNTINDPQSKFNNTDYGANRGRDGFYRGNNYMTMRGGYNNYNNYNNNYNNYSNRGGFNHHRGGRGYFNNYNNNYNYNYTNYNQQNAYQQQQQQGNNYNYTQNNFNNSNQQARQAYIFEMQQTKNMNLQQIGTMGPNPNQQLKQIGSDPIQPQP